MSHLFSCHCPLGITQVVVGTCSLDQTHHTFQARFLPPQFLVNQLSHTVLFFKLVHSASLASYKLRNKNCFQGAENIQYEKCVIHEIDTMTSFCFALPCNYFAYIPPAQKLTALCINPCSFPTFSTEVDQVAFIWMLKVLQVCLLSPCQGSRDHSRSVLATPFYDITTLWLVTTVAGQEFA